MITFSGTYDCKMDSKGRIVLPARLKARLPVGAGQRIVILRGFKKCLTIFTLDQWEEKLKAFAKVSEYDEAGRNFIRSYTNGMMEDELDGQGRLSLNKRLIDYAKLGSDVVVTGVGDLIEIWNTAEYENEIESDRSKLQATARNIFDSPKTPESNGQ